MPGELTTAIGAIGDPEGVRELGLEGLRRRRPGRPDLAARTSSPRPSSRHHEPTVVRRRRAAGRRRRDLLPDRRAVHRRVARSDARAWRARWRPAARRCCAAAPSSRATSPFSFQGLGHDGARDPRRGARRDRAAGRHRADLDAAHAERDRRGRRRDPGRRAQHAELRAARGRSASSASRCCSSAGSRSTLDELLMAADYVLKEGNERVILCERGIRTFETADALHARPRRRPVAQAAHAPAGDRRPLARLRRPPRWSARWPAAAAAVGRRRHHRRGAPRTPRRRSATARSSSTRRTSARSRPRLRRTRTCRASASPDDAGEVQIPCGM